MILFLKISIYVQNISNIYTIYIHLNKLVMITNGTPMNSPAKMENVLIWKRNAMGIMIVMTQPLEVMKRTAVSFGSYLRGDA